MDLDCDPLTAHAPSVVTGVQHCIVIHHSSSSLSSSPANFSGRLLPLLLLLKGFFGGQNGPRPRPVRHIKCPTAQLFRPCAAAGGATILTVIVVRRRRGFLFAVHRRRVGAMALRRRARQRIEPATAAAAATPHPLVLNVKLLSELAKNIIYLIVNGCGGRWGRPASLLDNRRPDLLLFLISGFIIVIVILVLGQMTVAEVASAPAGGGLGFGGGQEAVVEFADDPIEDVQTAAYVIAETQRTKIIERIYLNLYPKTLFLARLVLIFCHLFMRAKPQYCL
jgi:hypothetical protein